MNHPSVQWIDRELFLESTQYGLEDRENRVLPPLVTNEGANASVILDGRTYAQVYAEYVRFVAEVDRVCGGARGGKREFLFTDALAPFIARYNEMYWRIDRALESGDFDDARQAVRAFNEIATAGSICQPAEA
ncbi:MAG TPA: hypothetical protein DD435_09015 [Cyanobacteria bacterium UBA8530]|nr:hypothetical protein [Cyanobacteria bacterium UBA8530]